MKVQFQPWRVVQTGQFMGHVGFEVLLTHLGKRVDNKLITVR